jgi:hypothetical protein
VLGVNFVEVQISIHELMKEQYIKKPNTSDDRHPQRPQVNPHIRARFGASSA